MILDTAIFLPANFRRQDFLAFHNRDPQAIAEEAKADKLRKGILLDGKPACLTIEFSDHQAHAELNLDGTLKTNDQARFAKTLHHMLGLTQPVDVFEAKHQLHPVLGPLVRKQAGLRVPQSYSPYEALTWAITGQQITVSAAIALRRKLIALAGVRHSSGIACYPSAQNLAGIHEAELRQAGFSRTKAETLLTLSRLIHAGELPLESWQESLPVEQATHHLLGIRGIGPWTVNYALLRGFAWMDGSLHGDAAVRRGLKMLYGGTEDFNEKQAQDWLSSFSPWRALVAAHLWALSSPEVTSEPNRKQ